MNLRNRWLAVALAAALAVPNLHAEPFTFQGVLEQAGNPINGDTDLRFRLFGAASGGSPLGAAFDAPAWPIADGVLTIDLDFPGVVFDGTPRWLEIEAGGVVLSPRIAVLPAPLAASANALRGRSVSATAPAAGQVLKWSGSQWAPANEAGGSYSAGTGLSLAGSEFSIVPTFRLPQGCSLNQIPKWNGSAWTCQADAGTSYSAGAGLNLAGTTFSVVFAGSGNSFNAAHSNHQHLGQHWAGSGSHGLTVTSTDAFTALRGFNTNAGGGAAVGIHGEAQDNAQGVGVLGIGSARGIEGRAAANAADGVFGVNNLAAGTGAGVRGVVASPDGRGVLGQATAITGFNAGVRGESASGTGVGVEGASAATAGGTGVRGIGSNADGYGVVAMNLSGSGEAIALGATSSSPEAVVVRAQATSGTGTTTAIEAVAASGNGTGARGQGFIGLRGIGTGSGVGVHGSGATGLLAEGVQTGLWATVSGSGATAVDADATPASGGALGVRARSGAASGAGLRAENTATTGTANAIFATAQATSGDTLTVEALGAASSWAIRARSAGAGGRALSAELTNPATSGIALYGQVNSASGRAAQFVNLVPGAEAARFDGNVNVVGNVAKLGGSFRIDHPLDPGNKYLYHSFVESPDMMNLYNGNIVTDARGFATVELPDWFEALNGDYRYQLTVIGSFAQAIVAEEVAGNRFVIQTSQPQVKVSWQVSGIRQDAWARDHRIEVEVDKPAGERGRYLYPQGHGQPVTRGTVIDQADKPSGGA